MAIIQYTGIVNQLRGKLNGSVFNKTKTGYTLQRKQQQSKGSKGFQSEIRNIFSSVQRSWKSVSSVNQIGWQTTANNNPSRDRFGNLVALSGYNQFIKASVFASYLNTTLPGTPYAMPAPSASLGDTEVGSLAFDLSAPNPFLLEFLIALDVSDLSGDFGYLFDIALPVSDGVTVYHGRYVNVWGEVVTSNTSVVRTQNMGTRYPVPPATMEIFVRHRLVHIASGAVVQEIVVKAPLLIVT